MKNINLFMIAIVSIFCIGKCWAEEVNLYSARKEH